MLLTTAQEQRVQLFEGDLAPGGAAVVALVAALSRFHVAQQTVHFFDCQLAVGTYCTMASHGPQNLVLRALDHGAGVVLRQLSQNAACQLDRVSLS